jgi:hypothetical protein
MLTIWKYPLQFNLENDIAIVQMPKEAIVLKLSIQNETPTIWAKVDTEAEMEIRRFKIMGTGFPEPERGRYIDSLQERRAGAEFVWHIYEIPAGEHDEWLNESLKKIEGVGLLLEQARRVAMGGTR